MRMNRLQHQAITHRGGPLCIYGGPGTGKTRVLTQRIIHLIQSGVYADKILAVHSSHRAAVAMQASVLKCNPMSLLPFCGIFTQICLRIIREEEPFEKRGARHVPIKNSDQRDLVRSIISQMTTVDVSLNAVCAQIRSWKQQGLTPIDLLSVHFDNGNDALMREVYEAYELKKADGDMLDQEDLVLVPLRIFQSNNDILKKYQQRWEYVCIDDCQDVSDIQHQFMCLLMGSSNICVAGDPHQALASRDGGHVQQMRNFENACNDGGTVITLSENYRNRDVIQQCASLIISGESMRGVTEWNPQTLPRDVSGMGAMNHLLVGSYLNEARMLVDVCRMLRAQGVAYADMAILYRVSAQSRLIEDLCQREDIPCQLSGGTGAYERKEICDVINCLRFICSPDNTTLQ